MAWQVDRTTSRDNAWITPKMVVTRELFDKLGETVLAVQQMQNQNP
jgi:hypothetical protein